jgi:tripartite-type tricarboxylate transporter receptor subunit TctC
VLVVHPSLPVRSINDLISLAGKHPGKMNYASSGSGASPHLTMELLKNTKSLNITHIPYKGVPQALTDIIGGQIDMMFSTMAPAVPLVKAGRLRAIAVSGAKRSPALQDVPTMAESIPGFVAESWQGVLVPAGTPDAIIERLNRAIINALQQPDVGPKLIDLGFIPVGSGSQEFSSFLKSEITKWSKVVKASGASVD